jgi:hypothetical protein
VHVPKTAGTSVTAWFEPALRWNDLVLGGTEFGERIQDAYRDRFGLSKHMLARGIRNVVGECLWRDYFSFAFVRHPYPRLVSLYQWLQGAVAGAPADAPIWTWPHTQAFREASCFSDFVRDERFLKSHAGRPQADWVCDDSGTAIVDFVGRYESLAADIHTVADRVGLSDAGFGLENASKAHRPPGHAFKSPSDYEFVHDVYRRDFQMFDYDPDLRL